MTELKKKFKEMPKDGKKDFKEEKRKMILNGR